MNISKETEILKEFLDWLFSEIQDNDPDSIDIEDKAVEMGILKEVEASLEFREEFGSDIMLLPYWQIKK